jgi:hypothetical protein
MKSLLKIYFFSTLASLIFLFPACLATYSQIQTSWYDQDYSGGPVNKILVIFISKDNLQRRAFEDGVKQFFLKRGVGSYAGYKVIPENVEITEEFVKSCLVGIDANAILVSRITGMKKEREVVPGSYYYEPDFDYPFSRYYTRSYRSYYTPPTMVEVENLYFDSRLYRCDSEKLIWQLQLKIENLKPFNKVIDEFSSVVIKELSRKQLL